MSNKDEKIYLNLDEAVESENPKFVQLKDLIEAREELAKEAKLAESRRKQADVEIMEFLETYSADGAVIGDTVVDRRKSRTGGKWNKDKLSMILTPEQMEAVYTAGSEYTFVQVKTDAERAHRVQMGA